MKTLNRADFATTEDYIAALEAQNAEAKAKAAKGNTLRLKVSEKGGLSVYGLGRFPVTLYKEQWIRLLSHGQEIVEFIKENDNSLTAKADKAA